MLAQTSRDLAIKEIIRREPANVLDHRMAAVNAESDIYISHQLPASSRRVSWVIANWLNLQYSRQSSRKEVHTFLLRLSMFRSRVIIIKLVYCRSYVNQPLPFSLVMNNLIPDDAEILLACRSRDGDRVKRILSSRSGRPNDMTIGNITPLSVCSWFHDVWYQALISPGCHFQRTRRDRAAPPPRRCRS
jgi:hypothetical protein